MFINKKIIVINPSEMMIVTLYIISMILHCNLSYCNFTEKKNQETYLTTKNSNNIN